MVRTHMPLTVLTLAAGVLTPAPAAPQEPAPASREAFDAAEREAFDAVARAGAAIERAPRGNALRRAADQAVTAAEQAAAAFTAADGARDAALAAYRAAYREALAGAVTCGNGYPCTNGRIDPFDGFAAAFAAHFELLAAVSAANAAYVDAVGVPGADEARDRAARIRGLAARMRGLGAIDDPRRWNALVAGAGAEIAAGSLLHRRATEARHAADLALVDDVTRVVEALHLAGSRVARRFRPAIGGPSRGRRDRSGDQRARRGRYRQRRRVACGARHRAGRHGVAALPHRGGGNLGSRRAPHACRGEPARRALPKNPPRPATPLPTVPRKLRGPETTTPPATTPRPTRRHCGRGARTGRRFRRLGAHTYGGSPRGGAGRRGCRGRGGRLGSSRSRASSCSDAEARVTAAAARVSSLSVGDDRPRFVPARTGRETYSDLFHLLDAAQRRARAACGSIGR